jgi:thioredoxin 1
VSYADWNGFLQQFPDLIRYTKQEQNMASDKVIHLEDSNFEEETKTGYALIDFWAAWCGPCVALAPLIDEIAGNMDGKLKVCKVDVDKNMQTAARFGVRGIPFIVLLKDGKEVDSVTGNDPSRVSALAEQANS